MKQRLGKNGYLNVVSPVLAHLTHGGDRRAHPASEPTPTVTGANRGELGLISPVVVGCDGRAGQSPPTSAGSPLGTVTAKNDRVVVAPVVARLGQTGGNGAYSNTPDEPLTTVTGKAEHLLITPVIANLAHGDAKDGRDRGLRAGEATAPLGTVHAGGGSYAIIAPSLMPHYGGSESASVEKPLPTVTAGGMGKQVLIAPTLVQSGYGEREGQAPRALNIEAPLGTLVGSTKHALVSAFIAKHFGGMVGVPADTPLPTTTARGTQNQLAVANLVHLNHGEKTCSGPDEPARTVTAGGTHAALVYSFLTKYFGTAIGVEVDAPLPTATGKHRFGVVTVRIAGEPYVIVDIGMRMLRPRELARAQGFGEAYVLTGTNTNQVERIGNSVVPQVAEAIVRANCADMIRKAVAA